jgi:hypothetical protein
VALNRLGERHGSALVERLAGNAGVSAELVAEIVERSDGVPLFIEEMTNAVLEAGAQRGRELVTSVPATRLGVPATLQASLMARLDRLGPSARRVAQIGAAIGREFSYELVSAVGELSEERLLEALGRLVAAGLVFQRGLPPAAEYLFKHALVQDTAYGSLLRGPRQALHRRIAETLEARYPSVVQAQPEIAARHFGEALLVDKAVQYWHRAGKSSVAKSAVREPVAQLRRGLSLLDGVPETRERKQLALDLQVTLLPALMGAAGPADPEAIEAAQRARQLIAETDTAGSLLHFTVLFGLWAAFFVAGAAGDALSYATFRARAPRIRGVLIRSGGSRAYPADASDGISTTTVDNALNSANRRTGELSDCENIHVAVVIHVRDASGEALWQSWTQACAFDMAFTTSRHFVLSALGMSEIVCVSTLLTIHCWFVPP